MESLNVNQFTLTAKQRKRIADLERESFTRECQRMGIEPSQFEDFLLTISKKSIRQTIAQVSKANPHVDCAELFADDPMLNAPDWWSFKAVQLNLDAQRVFEQIMSCAHRLPIDHAYVQRTALALGIIQKGQANSPMLLAFLQAIPRVCLYGLEFNAFVDPTLDGTLPYVGVYEHLISSCEGFIELVLKYVLWHDSARDRAELVDRDECRRRGADRIFIDALSACLNYAAERQDAAIWDKRLSISTGEPQLQLPLRMAVGGSVEFAWFHEYGHLLRGHIERPHSHQLEFEADEFAFMVLSLDQDGGSDSETVSWWKVMGGLSLLFLLAILEKILGQGPSLSHPPGVERMASLFLHMTQSAAEFFVKYIICANELCGATLKECWAIDVDMGDDVIDSILALSPRGSVGQRPDPNKR